MKSSDIRMYVNKRLALKILLGLAVVACFLPVQVSAQANSISTFVACVNALGPTATAADAAAACVPSSGCYFTNTMSEESAQPACTLGDGTKLPRVIFSCPGPNGSQTLRFRPSFSLCTQGNRDPVINHIELGEDVRPSHSDSAGFGIQYMADVDMGISRPLGFSLFLPNTDPRAAVVDAKTPANTKGCADCHDTMGKVATVSGTFNTFAPVPPEVREGTLGTNDPFVVAPSPNNAVTLSMICSDIANSSQLLLPKNSQKRTLALNLCNALKVKEQ